MFRRRSRDSQPIVFATSGGQPVGPVHEWPNRDSRAAAAHAEAYNQQRQRLEAQMQRDGNDPDQPFVAKVFAMERRDGGAHTYTTWTEGIPTLLPPADVILLVEQPVAKDQEPSMTWLRWDVVADVCADEWWKVIPGFEPPRVLTVGWPSTDQLTVLKTRALQLA